MLVVCIMFPSPGKGGSMKMFWVKLLWVKFEAVLECVWNYHVSQLTQAAQIE